MIWAMASRSTARNAASPSSRKISGMVRPVMSSMNRSVSTNVRRSRRATFRPRVVLPLQLKPTRIKLSIRRQKRAVVPERLFETIPAKLDPHRIRQHDRDHCRTDDARGGHDAHITPLNVSDIALACGVVDRWQWVNE